MSKQEFKNIIWYNVKATISQNLPLETIQLRLCSLKRSLTGDSGNKTKKTEMSMSVTDTILQLTHTGQFIGYILVVVGSTFFFFTLRTVLFIRGTASRRSWKHSSEIWIHIATIASHSDCTFIGSTSMMWICRSTTFQRCFLRLRSGNCGGHFKKPVCEFCYTLCFPAGSRHWKMGTLWS